jgi:amidase
VYPQAGLVTGPDDARLRISVLTPTLTGREPEEAVVRELNRAAELCQRLGHGVEVIKPPEVDGPALRDGFFTAAALAMSQMSQMAVSALGRPPGPAELEPFTLELIECAATLPPDAAARSQRTLADAGRAYLELFERCDIVLSPTLARVSWPIGHLSPAAGRETLIRRTEEAVGYTPIHNAAGCPAMTVPLGSHDGLPVGIHFAARPGADRSLLSLAYELEAAAPWSDAVPDISWLTRRA